MIETVKGVFRDGRIELTEPVDWPEGTEVSILLRPVQTERMGIDESEWRDDPEAMADWEVWARSLEPLEYTPEEEAEMKRWNAVMKAYNIEAVRKQWEEMPE